MDKENKKKTVNNSKNSAKKSEPKKTTTKSGTKKSSTTKNSTIKKVAPVNENIKENNQSEIINDNLIECVYCHQKFEKGYTICPHCRKRQKNSISLMFFIVILSILLFAIICFHFIEKSIGKNNTEEDYKQSCELVDYENLVRHPKDYKNKDIRVIGDVIDVTGYDDGFGNVMQITINANQFENGEEQLITIDYTDKDYSQGFLIGDTITVYGEYTNINGNIPNITAKYIIFGK